MGHIYANVYYSDILLDFISIPLKENKLIIDICIFLHTVFKLTSVGIIRANISGLPLEKAQRPD